MTAAQLHSPPRALPEDQRFVRSPEVLWRAIPGVAVIVLPHGEQDVVLLSGTGLALWDQLRFPTCLAEIATRMAAQYGVLPGDVVDSLGDVLLELRDHGIVRDDDG